MRKPNNIKFFYFLASMSNIVVLQSLAKEYLASKFAWRRQQKIYSMMKFAMVFSLLIVVVGVYANLVTSASTKWYFLEKAKNELASLEFNKGIQQLEVIKMKKDLWSEMKLKYHDSWFQSIGSNMVTINAYDTEYVANDGAYAN